MGVTTLRAAIEQANTLAGDDTITFDASVAGGTITLGGTQLAVSSNLTITGPAARMTVDGNNASQVFNISAGTVEMSNLTVTKGSISPGQGGGIDNNGVLMLNGSTVSGNSASQGGGIANDGMLTLNNSTVSGNSATGYADGILNFGTLTLNNSTVSGNSGGATGIGGIDNWNTLTLNNSTVSGNSSTGIGAIGGIGNRNTSTLTLNNSTVSGNSATGNGGGIYGTSSMLGNSIVNLNHSTITNNTADSDSDGGDGGGIYGTHGLAGTTTINFTNSIVAGNTDISTPANNDCYNNVGALATLNSLGYNIVGNNDGCSIAAGTGDDFGTTASPVDAKLLALADNGGPTKTHALDNGSPALEQIPLNTNGCGTTYTTDQRGEARPGTKNQPTNQCEIGAWEAQTTDPTAITLSSFTAWSGGGSLVYLAVIPLLIVLGGGWMVLRKKVGNWESVAEQDKGEGKD